MKLQLKQGSLIKNKVKSILWKDFQFNVLSFFILAMFLAAGIIVQSFLRGGVESLYIVYIVLGTLAAGAVISLMPAWHVIVKLIILSWIALFIGLPISYYPVFIFLSLGFIAAPAVQIAKEWEKAVVLRLGKFKSLNGPGVFLILPMMDSVIRYVDTRIRATDFRAETTLTKDTVPTNVNAIAFWMVWDAKKAVIEVENFMEAVILSSQAVLRDAIGRHDLSELLSERERLGKEIQKALDAKTNSWGITVLSIEISDIIIPKELEDSMSKQAQAERERMSRVILGTAEVEVAEKFEEASEKYKNNPTALHLRAMNMIFEGLKKQGSIILLPSSAIESMSLGTVLGSAAFVKNAEKKSIDNRGKGE